MSPPTMHDLIREWLRATYPGCPWLWQYMSENDDGGCCFSPFWIEVGPFIEVSWLSLMNGRDEWQILLHQGGLGTRYAFIASIPGTTNWEVVLKAVIDDLLTVGDHLEEVLHRYGA
jgi:hypothetical protein